MSDCIFCKIVAGEIPSTLVYEDDEVVAFNDLNPQAPKHILIIPRKHYPNLDNMESELMGSLLKAARAIGKEQKVDEEGYRLVINRGASAGQTVFHLHVHLLAGRGMGWPPG